jgi:glutamine synthetase
MAEAIELWRDSAIAVECFGADVHRHVLVHAEYEWQAFNRSVTDWERARYFERI